MAVNKRDGLRFKEIKFVRTTYADRNACTDFSCCVVLETDQQTRFFLPYWHEQTTRQITRPTEKSNILAYNTYIVNLTCTYISTCSTMTQTSSFKSKRRKEEGKGGTRRDLHVQSFLNLLLNLYDRQLFARGIFLPFCYILIFYRHGHFFFFFVRAIREKGASIFFFLSLWRYLLCAKGMTFFVFAAYPFFLGGGGAVWELYDDTTVITWMFMHNVAFFFFDRLFFFLVKRTERVWVCTHAHH